MDAKTIERELRENPALLRNVMGSPDARALLDALNRDRDGFRQAVRSAAAGENGDLSRRLGDLARSPDGAALLARVEAALNRERNHGGV